MTLVRGRQGPAIGDVDLRLLRVFKSVVEAGGMSNAQLELDVGLATISKQISDLEIRLGMRLCTRGRERFGLTEQGRLVYEAALALFSSIDEFRAELTRAHAELSGDLKIGLIDNTITDPRSPLVAALAAFRGAAPKVHLRLSVSDLESIERGLLEGRLAIGIVPIYVRHPDLEYFPLYAERTALFCGAAHDLFGRPDGEIGDEELLRQSYVAHDYVDNEAKRLIQGSSCGATAWQVEGVALLILTGQFVGFLPTHYGERFAAQGLMRAIQPERRGYSTEFGLALRRGTRRNRLVEKFMSVVGIA